jgi:type III restriction enzyme
MTWIDYDASLVDDIAARLDLRAPNASAVRAVAEEIADGDGREVVCDLATGVGKTYILAGLVDYLTARRSRTRRSPTSPLGMRSLCRAVMPSRW